MRKFYKSNINKCKRASETITVVPRTTVYSDGRKVTIKVPLCVPSIKSAITVVLLLSSAIKTLSTGITEVLQEAQVFNDTVTNKTVVSFASMVLILLLNHLRKFNQFRIGSFFFLCLQHVFTVVINSYRPILLSMFRSLKNVLIKQNQTCEDMKNVVNMLDGLTHIPFSVKSPPSWDRSPSNASASSASSSTWGLWCWTFVCLACSFAASLFIASACYSL
jgi:hypothetical protein